MQRKLKLVLGVCAVGIALAALLQFPSLRHSINERKYRNIFTSVPDVKKVTDFLDYEGKRSAGLHLTNERYLYIAAFDDSIGTETRRVTLSRIGHISITCSRDKDREAFSISAFNIIEVMRSSPLHLELKNIGDIVAHYDDILGYVDSAIPEPTLPAAQLKIGSQTFWCSKHINPESRP